LQEYNRSGSGLGDLEHLVKVLKNMQWRKNSNPKLSQGEQMHRK